MESTGQAVQATAPAGGADSFILNIDEDAAAPVMLIAFAGIADGFAAMPVFEFVKLLSDVKVHKMFLRDPNHHWFQNGAPGIADDPRGVAEHLRAECVRRNVKRVVVIGSSAGGYSALLFGLLLGADEIHAFAPRTRIKDASDFRVPERHPVLHAAIRTDKAILDLRELALTGGGKAKRIYIHYPRYEVTDVRHAKYMADVEGVRLRPYHLRTHLLVSELRRKGVLKPLIVGAVAGSGLDVDIAVLRGQLLLRRRKRSEAVVRAVARILGRPASL